MHNEKKLSRREILTRAVPAGATAVGACYLGAELYTTDPPPARAVEPITTLGNFRISGAAGRMSIIRGADRTKTAAAAVDAIGGMGAFVKKGDRVLVKVNAAFATPPSLSATTHPDLVAEIVRQCRSAGAQEVIVTDNPINDPASCFELSGIADAARKAGAKVVLPRANMFNLFSLPDGELILNWPVMAGPFAGVNKIIGATPVKHHARAGASMSMKNWYGLLGGRRNIFHRNINRIITELAMMSRPTLVFLDGTTTMVTNGPTGGSLDDLEQTDTMIAATDQVAADAFGATLLGHEAADLPYIKQAAEAGLGVVDYRSLNPVQKSI